MRTVIGRDIVIAGVSGVEDRKSLERREQDQKDALITFMAFLGFGMSLIQFLDSRRGK